MEEERETGRECTGLWRWVGEEDEEDEDGLVSSPREARFWLDLDVRESSRLLELVLVLRRKCSSKSGRPRGRGEEGGDDEDDLIIGMRCRDDVVDTSLKEFVRIYPGISLFTNLLERIKV